MMGNLYVYMDIMKDMLENGEYNFDHHSVMLCFP